MLKIGEGVSIVLGTAVIHSLAIWTLTTFHFPHRHRDPLVWLEIRRIFLNKR